MLTNVQFAVDFIFGGGWGGHCQKEQGKIHLAEPWDNESKLPRINPKEP